jgi:hypothetical protein
MTVKHERLNSYLRYAEMALQDLNAKGYVDLDGEQIWAVLAYQFEVYDIPTEIIHLELSSDQIVNSVIDFYAQTGKSLGDISVKRTILPEEFFVDALEKADIKINGEIWRVHKNDADPFPSAPHAHNYRMKCKLHLGNGKLYRKADSIGKIDPKDLLVLRSEIKSRLKLKENELPTLDV